MQLRWLERNVDDGDGTGRRERVLQYRERWTELSTEGVIGQPFTRYGPWQDVPVVQAEDLPDEASFPSPALEVTSLPHSQLQPLIALLGQQQETDTPVPFDDATAEALYV